MARNKKKRRNLAQVIPDLMQVYRYFRNDISRHGKLIAASFAALICGVIFRILEPWPLKFVLDQVFEPPSDKSANTVMLPQEWSATTVVVFVSISVVVIAVFRALSEYTARVGFFNVGNKVVIRIRNRVYRHVHALPLAFHDRARHGDLITRITRDVSLLRDVTATAILPLIGSSMVLIGMAAVMIWLNWKLAAISLVILPLYWLTTVRLGRQIRETARKQRQRESAMATIASQSLTSIRAIKAFALENRFASDFDRKNNQSQRDDFKASRLSLKLGRTVDILLAISTATVLSLGAWMVLNGQMYPGDLVVFLVYLKRSFKPAQEFAKYTARMAKAAAAGERVIQILERPVEPPDTTGTIALPVGRGKIEFHDVCFGYDPHQLVLKDFDLTISPGETVGITGHTGSGKSTLVNLLLRFYEPRSGKIVIDGHDVSECSLSSLRSRFRVLLQDPCLFAMSLRDNIAMGTDDSVSESAILKAARLAEVDEFALDMPQQYDSLVGERSTTLSRGQSQRIAIARAAIADDSILLLDEPTTGLDKTTRTLVTESLLDLAASRTTLIITHDLQLVRRCDRIAVIANGRVAQYGSHDELANVDGPYRSLCSQSFPDGHQPITTGGSDV